MAEKHPLIDIGVQHPKQDEENRKSRKGIPVMALSSLKYTKLRADKKKPLGVSDNNIYNRMPIKLNQLRKNKSNHALKKPLKKKLTPIDEIREDLTLEVSSCSQVQEIPTQSIACPPGERKQKPDLHNNENNQNQNINILQPESVLNKKEVEEWHAENPVNKVCDKSLQTECFQGAILRRFMEMHRHQLYEMEKLSEEHLQEFENKLLF